MRSRLHALKGGDQALPRPVRLLLLSYSQEPTIRSSIPPEKKTKNVYVRGRLFCDEGKTRNTKEKSGSHLYRYRPPYRKTPILTQKAGNALTPCIPPPSSTAPDALVKGTPAQKKGNSCRGSAPTVLLIVSSPIEFIARFCFSHIP